MKILSVYIIQKEMSDDDFQFETSFTHYLLQRGLYRGLYFPNDKLEKGYYVIKGLPEDITHLMMTYPNIRVVHQDSFWLRLKYFGTHKWNGKKLSTGEMYLTS